MHKVSVQEVASSLAAIKLTSVNKMNGVAVWYSVGAFAQQRAAPEAHRSPVNAGSSIIGMLQVIERHSTKNLAELSLAQDEAERGSNVSNGALIFATFVNCSENDVSISSRFQSSHDDARQDCLSRF